MKKRFMTLSVFLLVFAGVSAGLLLAARTPESLNVEPVSLPEPVIIETAEASEPTVVFPVDGYADHRTMKGFGEYVDDRFTGYHVAEDIEIDDVGAEIPVHAIADGEVKFAGWANGYGGVMIITHVVEGETVSAVYGHLDVNSMSAKTGDAVLRNQTIAMLGDHESEETDGARKHLHFGMYHGSDIRFPGYVQTAEEVSGWMNPGDFLVAHGLEMNESARMYDPAADQGGAVFQTPFEIPAGLEVEYVPSIPALNLYTLSGEGTARSRSQMMLTRDDF